MFRSTLLDGWMGWISASCAFASFGFASGASAFVSAFTFSFIAFAFLYPPPKGRTGKPFMYWHSLSGSDEVSNPRLAPGFFNSIQGFSQNRL